MSLGSVILTYSQGNLYKKTCATFLCHILMHVHASCCSEREVYIQLTINLHEKIARLMCKTDSDACL